MPSFNFGNKRKKEHSEAKKKREDTVTFTDDKGRHITVPYKGQTKKAVDALKQPDGPDIQAILVRGQIMMLHADHKNKQQVHQAFQTAKNESDLTNSSKSAEGSLTKNQRPTLKTQKTLAYKHLDKPLMPEVTVDGQNIKIDAGSSVAVNSKGNIEFHSRSLDTNSIRESMKPMDHMIENAGINLKSKKQALDFKHNVSTKEAFNQAYGPDSKLDSSFKRDLKQFLNSAYAKKGPAFAATAAKSNLTQKPMQHQNTSKGNDLDFD